MTTDPKTIERLRELAEKIANDLFTRGDGVKGGHFRMHSDNGEYLSGWSEGPLRDRVYAILVKEVDLDYRHQEICQECGIYPADHKGYCEGCLAYREHQA